jgi:curved DNA-binding protein CbpA
MTKSLYAILNIAPDADPAVVDAAYKALMKKYHPDVLAGGPSADMRSAAEINEAFHILRDPAKRAHYDANQWARQEAVRVVMSAHDMRSFQAKPPPRRRSKWTAMLLLGLLGLLSIYVWQQSEEGGLAEAAFARGWLPGEQRNAAAAVAAKDSTDPHPVRQVDIDRAMAEFRRITKESGLIGLSAYSQDCFATQGRTFSLADFDHCVAFDQAASSYDGGMPSSYLPQLPRFEAEESIMRHAAAGRLLSNNDTWIGARLAEVQALTSARLQADADAEASSSTAVAQMAAPVVQPSAPKRRYANSRAARAAKPGVPRQRGQSKPADRDFLEREGYIY